MEKNHSQRMAVLQNAAISHGKGTSLDALKGVNDEGAGDQRLERTSPPSPYTWRALKALNVIPFPGPLKSTAVVTIAAPRARGCAEYTHINGEAVVKTGALVFNFVGLNAVQAMCFITVGN